MYAASASFNPLLCLFIAMAVVLSGAHAKDLVGMSLPALWTETRKQADDPQTSQVKIQSELHTHVEKITKVFGSGDQSGQADSRSLRLLNEHKRGVPNPANLAQRLRAWWQLHALYLASFS